MVAVSHELVVVLYHILTRQEPYRDPGGNLLRRAQAGGGRLSVGASSGEAQLLCGCHTPASPTGGCHINQVGAPERMSLTAYTSPGGQSAGIANRARFSRQLTTGIFRGTTYAPSGELSDTDGAELQ